MSIIQSHVAKTYLIEEGDKELLSAFLLHNKLINALQLLQLREALIS